MKPFSHAFEIGYTPSLEVLDHSSLILNTLPGTPEFSNILPKLRAKLNIGQMEQVAQLTSLYIAVQKWVKQSTASDTFHIGDIDYLIKWKRPDRDAGVCSLLVDSKLAFISLLIRDHDRMDMFGRAGGEFSALFAFMQSLNEATGQEDFYDHRKFRLVDITRRPLVASVFWPPFSPTSDLPARTIQRQIAHAFFYLDDEP